MTTPFRWIKGHGTENDFVLLPDPDGSIHGSLDAELVRALCHRRRGIGADGVLRVIRAEAYDDADAQRAAGSGVEWFMDYRNADGSTSQMCGNGIRVLARFLEWEGLVDTATPLAIGTRDGVKVVRWRDDGRLSVDMGAARVVGDVKIGVGSGTLPALHVDVGNPHAVAFVGALDEAGPPSHDSGDFPDGVNVEFVVRTGPTSAAMRVFERGVGETRSCGTGACAVAAAVANAPATVTVETPGGALEVTLSADGGAELSGDAVLVAEGTYPVP